MRSMIVGALVLAGSGAAARAADAVVVAEPEPVEYVRVCDVFGAGFFYIPGTETCLQISGEVFYQIAADDQSDGWVKTTRARLNVDARSETEWGALRAYLRLNAEWGDPADGAVEMDQAIIELGGLRMGYTESAWVEAQVGEVAAGGSHSDTALSYGDQQRHLIAYSFQTQGGFFGALSLEDDTLDGEGYVPDVVGLVGLERPFGGVWAKAAYDESASEWAATAGLQINVPNMTDSSFRLIGFYSSGPNAYEVTPYFTALAGAEWSVLGSFYHQFTPKFGASVGAQYFSDVGYIAGVDAWQAEASAVWVPVENFEVRGEVFHGKTDGEDGHTGGFLRFTRFF